MSQNKKSILQYNYYEYKKCKTCLSIVVQFFFRKKKFACTIHNYREHNTKTWVNKREWHFACRQLTTSQFQSCFKTEISSETEQGILSSVESTSKNLPNTQKSRTLQNVLVSTENYLCSKIFWLNPARGIKFF